MDVLVVVVTLLGCTGVKAADAECPAGMVVVGHVAGGAVCEDFTILNGSVRFPSGIVLQKRLYAQAVTATWGGLTPSAVNSANDDAVGKALLRVAAADGRDVTYDEVLAALPPIISGWGEKPNFGYAGQHTFTGSREATVDIVFDHKGDSGQWQGFPRPLTVIPEKFDQTNVFHGLLGGELPVLVWVYPITASAELNVSAVPKSADEVVAGCRWEMTVVPIADVEHNHEQPVLFRFARLCGSALSGDPLYFDTNIYTPDFRPPSEGMCFLMNHWLDARCDARIS